MENLALVSSGDLRAIRDSLFPGWWTYAAVQRDLQNRPLYRILCRTSAECQFARLVQPASIRVEFVEGQIRRPRDLRAIARYLGVPGFPAALFLAGMVEALLATTFCIVSFLAIAGVTTALPAAPALAAAFGLSGLAVVNARLLARWLAQ